MDNYKKRRKKLQNEKAELQDKINLLEEENSKLKNRKNYLIKDNKRLFKNNKSKQSIKVLKNKNRKLEKYVERNPENVTSRKINIIYVVTMLAFFLILICAISYICNWGNFTNNYKKFLLPFVITIGSILFINLPENILGLISHIMTNEKLNERTYQMNILTGKAIGNIIIILLIPLTIYLYDKSPSYYSDIDESNFRINFDKDMKIEGNDRKTKSLNSYLKTGKYSFRIIEKKEDKKNKK